jgi:non-lysosomal glucosylceramidase
VTDPASGDFGLIYEYLGSFGLGPLDVTGGRVMADTTSLWVVEAFELWRNTGDVELLAQLYPAAARAIRWQVNRARALGVPDHLVNTYDITNPQEYNATTFNAVLYLTSMQVGALLATAAGDATTAALAQAAYAVGVNATLALLWNASASYFTAFTGVPGSLHADCLYGQALSLYLLGPAAAWHFPPAQVAAHLDAETRYNGNAFGFTVVTGRSPTPAPVPAPAAAAQLAPARAHAAERARVGGHILDSTNWLGAAPTWSALSLALGQLSLADSLDPTQRALDNFRTRLNDLWDFTGLTSGEWGTDSQNGQPHTTRCVFGVCVGVGGGCGWWGCVCVCVCVRVRACGWGRLRLTQVNDAVLVSLSLSSLG